MNWLLALIIVGALFFGAFALCVSAATKSTVEIIDYTTRVLCYDVGWDVGSRKVEQPPPLDGSECESLYSEGIEDGTSGVYNRPARE